MDAYDSVLTKRFREAVEAQIARVEKIIASGSCVDFETYKGRCGEVVGLHNALKILEDEIHNLNKEGP